MTTNCSSRVERDTQNESLPILEGLTLLRGVDLGFLLKVREQRRISNSASLLSSFRPGLDWFFKIKIAI